MKLSLSKYGTMSWITAGVIAVSTLVSCAGADGAPESAAEGDGAVEFAQISEALQVLQAPICDQRFATNMDGGGDYSQHPGDTMRLNTPGSYLYFWLNPPFEAGQWEFQVSARAHGNGSGYPTLRLWIGSELVGQEQVTSWPNLQTYTFQYQKASTGSSLPVVLEYTGSQWSRDLIVEGVDIVCPGISCGDNVCTDGNICCDGSELDEPICTTNSCVAGGDYGFTLPRYCDSHEECGEGELCGFGLQGNVPGVFACMPEQSFSNPDALPFKLCASPGWTDSCGSGRICGEPDNLGYAYCPPQ